MDEKILDAVCILPRIELLCGYLDEEIDQLQEWLKRLDADEFYSNKICSRMHQLVWMSEEMSKKVFDDVNKLMEV